MSDIPFSQETPEKHVPQFPSPPPITCKFNMAVRPFLTSFINWQSNAVLIGEQRKRAAVSGDAVSLKIERREGGGESNGDI